MSRAAAKHAPKLAVEKEMSDLGGVRKVKLGLALKFTLPVTAAISFLIILMGLVVYRSTADALENEINHNGIFAARLAASPEIDSWEEGYNTVDDLSRKLAVIDAKLALAGGSVGSEVSATGAEAQERLRKEIERHDADQKAFNRKRLSGLLSQGALDLLIIPPGETTVKASASGSPTLSFREERTISDAGATRITTGAYQVTKDGQTVLEPARFFTHPIKDKKGTVAGWAKVVFSEAGLRADLDALRRQIIIFCVFGVLTCAVIAYVTSRIFTRPLVALLQDINAVAGGDLHHRTRVRTSDEIGTLAHAFDEMTKNLSAAEVMRVDLAEKEHQVLLGQEVQERLFPKVLPQTPGIELDAANRLASDLSANLFDVTILENGRIGILVMTASGRGIPAAIVLSMARALFRARGVLAFEPVDALKAINSLLAPDLRRGMYVSALYAVIDPATGSGTLASAGHRVPVLHFVAASQGLRKLQASGIAMGLDKGPVFDRSLTGTTFALTSGDRLVVATEGAFQLKDQQDQPLGEDAFVKLVLAACKKGATAEMILASITTRLGAKPGEYDITLVSAARR